MRHESGKPDFWNDNTLATTTLKKISVLEKEIELLMTLDLAKSDIGVLLEFADRMMCFKLVLLILMQVLYHLHQELI